MKKLFLILFLCMSLNVFAQQREIILAVPDLGDPISFYNEFNQPSGFFIEIVQELLRNSPYKLKYISGSFSECMGFVRDGKADLITMTMYTKERDEYLDFGSQILYSSWSLVMIHKDSNITRITDLQDKTIGVMKNDANAESFKNLIVSFNISVNFIEYSSFDEVEDAISNREVDAGISTSLHTLSNENVIISNILFNPTQTYAATTEGKNQDLLIYLDQKLIDVKKNRESFYYELTNKYFIREITIKKFPIWIYFFAGGVLFVIVLITLWSIILRTAVKRRTQQLNEISTKYKYLFDNMSQGVVYQDLDEKIVSINRAGEEILGLSSVEVEGKTSEDPRWKALKENGEHANPSDHPTMITLKTEKEASTILGIWNHQLNERRWINIKSNPIIENKKMTGVFAVFDDITEIKNKKDEYLKIIEHIPSAFAYHRMIYDDKNEPIDYMFLDINENFSKITSYTDAKLKKISDFMGSERAKKWAIYWNDKLSQNNNLIETYDDNTKKWYETICYWTEENRFVVIFNDITEKKEFNLNLEKIIKERSEKLIESEKMASLGQLITGIAHEINTPLNITLTSIENIRNLLALTDKIEYINNCSVEEISMMRDLFTLSAKTRTLIDIRNRRQLIKNMEKYLQEKNIEHEEKSIQILADIGLYDLSKINISILNPENWQLLKNTVDLILILQNLDIILISSDKISKIVSSLKIYSHTDITEEMQEFNLLNEINSVLILYQSNTKHAVKINLNCNNDIIVKGFKDKLNQVWFNLISNSLQAVNYKGEINISVEKTDKIVFSISNSGPKIPEEIQHLIFNPFFTTKKTGEGTGLGLSICKEIVLNHSGNIYFETSDEKTTFYVELPIEEKK